MIVDANLMVYAVTRSSPHHAAASRWLEDALNGPTFVGFPWPSVVAFLRVATNPRALTNPLTIEEAWSTVERWLDVAVADVPAPGARHREILGRLVRGAGATGNLIHDAHLAALAIEHGRPVYSADTDFARFPDARWVNPVAPMRS